MLGKLVTLGIGEYLPPNVSFTYIFATRFAVSCVLWSFVVSITKLSELLKTPPVNARVDVIGTDATPAMPDHCKIPGDVVGSYRKYYILEKRRFAKWEKPNAVMPDWYKEGIYNGTNGWYGTIELRRK